MKSLFFVHEFTQIRADLAIGVWMLAVLELDRSRGRAVLLTCLAALIHIQAALGLIVIGLQAACLSRRGRTVISLTAVGVILAAPTRVFDRLGYALLAQIPDPRVAVYLAIAETDTWVRPNPFSFMSLLALATGVIGLVGSRSEKLPSSASQQAVFLSLLTGSAALGALAAVTVAAFRVSEHFLAFLPAGLWILWERYEFDRRLQAILWGIAAVQAYIYVFHSPYLLEP
jgi:hypothetical protein